MMKKNILHFITIALIISIFTSCGNSSGSTKVAPVDLSSLSPEQLIKIDLPEIQEIYPMSTIFDTVCYIKLETTPECLIGSITKVLFFDNKFVIMDGGNARPILAFTSTGKFLHKIGDCGSGPKEYASLDDIVYDQFNNELVIWSNNDRKILRFRPDGTFISSVQLNYWISNIAVYDKDILMAYVNNTKQRAGHGKDYHFLFLDRDGKVVSELDEYDSDKDICRGMSSQSLTSHNNTVLFRFPSTNGVYQISRDSMELKYYVDFGKHNLPLDFFKGKSTRDVRKELSDLHVGTVFSFSESDTHIFVMSNYNKMTLSTLIDKQTQKQISFYLLINNEQNLSYPQPAFVTILGNQLIGFCESGTFERTRDFYSELQHDVSEQNIKRLLLQRYEKAPDGTRKKKVLDAVEKMHFKYNHADHEFASSVNSDDNPLIFIGTIRSNF